MFVPAASLPEREPLRQAKGILMTDKRTLEWAALGAVLLMAFLDRVIYLDFASVWIDEFLVILSANKPLSYLYAWNKEFELHPIGFYFLVKAAMILGDSVFWLRLVSVLLTVAALWATYGLALQCFANRHVSLFVAAVLAVLVIDYDNSRNIRPYAVLLLVCALQLLFFLRFSRSKSTNDFSVFLILSYIALNIHYFSVFPLAASGIGLVMIVARDRSLWTIRNGCLALAFLACSVPTVLLAKGQFANWDGNTGIKTFSLDVIASYWTRLQEVAVPSLAPGSGLLVLACAIVGTGLLFLKSVPFALIMTLYVLLPPALFYIRKNGLSLNSYHLSYIQLFVCLGVGSLASRLRPGWWLSIGAVGVVAAQLVLHLGQPPSKNNHTYKENVQAVLRQDGFLPMHVTPMWYYPYLWYFGQLAGVTDARAFAMPLPPVRFVSDQKELDKQHPGTITRGTQLAVSSPALATYVVNKRQEPLAVSETAAVALRSWADILAAASSVENVAAINMDGGILSPAANNAISRIVLVFSGNTANPARATRLKASGHFRVLGKESIFFVKGQFDQEAPQAVFVANGPFPLNQNEDRSTFSTIITRDKPFTSFVLTIEMIASLSQPRYWGGNLETVGLFDLFVVPE